MLGQVVEVMDDSEDWLDAVVEGPQEQEPVDQYVPPRQKDHCNLWIDQKKKVD